MTDIYERDDLLLFFKALADKSRLRLLGLLAQREYSVQELAALAGLKEPTVSHHLGMLKRLGLVSQRRDANTHWYALEPDAITALARRLSSPEQIAELAGDAPACDWQAKVIETFVGPEGKIRSIPASRKKRWALLAWLVRQFDEDRCYPEKEINARLLERHWDSATLRREFIGYRMMARERGSYWRLPESQWVLETGQGSIDMPARPTS
jgi:DNA-binding MarR family transcriptional regulator